MKNEMLEGLERTAEIVVMFDPAELCGLGQAHEEFSRLAALAASGSDKELAEAFAGMADMVELIVLEEVPDRDAALAELSERIAMLSSAIREERKLENIRTVTPKAPVAPAVSMEDSFAGEFMAAIAQEAEIVQDFVIEARDHLESSSPALLELEKKPGDSESINLVFRCFHSIKGVAGFLNMKTVQTLSHHAEDILDQVRSGKRPYDKDVSNLMFEALDALSWLLDELGRALTGGQAAAKADCDLSGLEERLLKALGRTVNAPVPQPSAAPPLSAAAAPAARTPGAAGRKEVIKVDADRLNRLIDTIGELVIAETIVLESDETRSSLNPSYLRKISQLDKITRELQTMGMALRMVAVKPTFQHMARLVRDLAEKQDKKVEFLMRGEDTEIDKNIVDKIGDPLVHMIRNAVDHGIEDSVQARISAGKSPVAKIEIRAFHRGGDICIEIEDDGRGIDPDRVFRKAVERGIIAADANLSRNEIVNLIFMPGFSTAEKITDVSGRGVGMDVVKRNIAELNGTVEIASEPGRGSVFSIRLPLTLAIIDGMIVQVAGERFIVPTLSITRAVKIESGQIHHVEGREFILHQNRNVPLYRLGRFLGLGDGGKKDMLMLILDDGAGGAGIIVDALLGKQQIVIKSLGEVFQKVNGYSGCAILSDGGVGLIIDVNSVIKNYVC